MLIHLAEQEIGVSETPKNSNKTKYGKWADLKGYEGLYQIDEYGNIKAISNQKSINSLIGKNGSVILKQQKNRLGYLKILLTKDGKRKTHVVHRLVCSTFKENPLNKETVNHIDGNRSNNHVDNLEWATQSENIRHSFEKLGKVSCWKGRTLGKHHCSKKVICLETGFVFDSVIEAANYIHTIPSHMSNHLNGRIEHIRKRKFQFV